MNKKKLKEVGTVTVCGDVIKHTILENGYVYDEYRDRMSGEFVCRCGRGQVDPFNPFYKESDTRDELLASWREDTQGGVRDEEARAG